MESNHLPEATGLQPARTTFVQNTLHIVGGVGTAIALSEWFHSLSHLLRVHLFEDRALSGREVFCNLHGKHLWRRITVSGMAAVFHFRPQKRRWPPGEISAAI